MKHHIYLIAIAVFAFSACVKELSTESNGHPQEEIATYTPANIFASVDSSLTKTILDGLDVKWVNRDSIGVYQYGKYKVDDKEVYRDGTQNKFVASGDGSKVHFTGSIKNFVSAGSMYGVYPFDSTASYSVSNSRYTKLHPSVQTGRPEDCGKYMMMWCRAKNVQLKDGVLNFDMSFETSVPILKFTVPEGLGAKSIKITAKRGDNATPVNLSGTIRYKFNNNAMDIFPNVDSITIDRGGETISGTVMAFLAGDRSNFKSTAKYLTFRLKDEYGGTASFSGLMKGDSLSPAVIKNLGSMPSSIVYTYPPAPGELVFKNTTGSPTVTMDNYYPGTEFYYVAADAEVGMDPSTMPTTESPVFDPATGLVLNGTSFDDKCIKILLHRPPYQDKIVMGRARQWKFNKTSNIGVAFYGLPIAPDEERPVDGITFINVGSSSVNFEEFKTDRLTWKTGIRANLKVLSTGTEKVKFAAVMASNSSTKSRTIYFGYTSNIATKTTPVGGSKAFYDLAPINRSVNDDLLFYGGGGLCLYNTMLLETGSNLVFPLLKAEAPVFAYNPDTHKLTATSATPGAQIYYSTSATSDPGTPATLMPAEGITVESLAYFRAYASASGFRNSPETEAAVYYFKFPSSGTYSIPAAGETYISEGFKFIGNASQDFSFNISSSKPYDKLGNYSIYYRNKDPFPEVKFAHVSTVNGSSTFYSYHYGGNQSGKAVSLTKGGSTKSVKNNISEEGPTGATTIAPADFAGLLTVSNGDLFTWIYTNATNVYGFAFLEQGKINFPTSTSPALGNETVGGVDYFNF